MGHGVDSVASCPLAHVYCGEFIEASENIAPRYTELQRPYLNGRAAAVVYRLGVLSLAYWCFPFVRICWPCSYWSRRGRLISSDDDIVLCSVDSIYPLIHYI
ncbi:hypothetical protein BaRGS_00020917 [Batillaria attramentaria]|uniref:Uncharacterized protein n=1 Tax=Batillaria attramentaria TaxID=370345 RepID=A0ABD0KM01_9CAEN